MVIVITGASRGIGYAIAQAYTAAGHTPVLVARTEAQLHQARQQLQQQYPDVPVGIFAADLSQRSDIERLAAHLFRHYPVVDVLVNNAGHFVPGSVHDEADGTLASMLDAHVWGAYHLTRLLLPGMMQRKQGYIINMCSIAAVQAYPNGGSYSIAKHALHGMGKNLREELKPHGIKVTNILPGATYTDSWKPSGLPPERFMQPDDIARIVVTLTSLSAGACVEEIVMRPQLGDI